MKNTTAAVMGLIAMTVSVPAGAATPAYLWSQRFGDASQQISESVATDAAGNVYIAGHFDGTVSFGGGNLTSGPSGASYLAKFNASGVHVWSKMFSGGSVVQAMSVATDPSGNVYLAGMFYGTVSFGLPGLTSAGGRDIFLVKFDPAGAPLWNQRFGDTSDQFAQAVTTDASGNVSLTGYFYGSVDFGGGALTSAGGSDIFVAKFDAAGVHQWSKRFGDGTDFQQGYSVATDASGSVYLAGYFYVGSVDFGGGIMTSAGGYDAFLVKFNAAGVHQWSKQFGNAMYQQAFSVTTDPSGDVYVTGYFGGTVSFGGPGLVSAGSNDVFLAKYNTSGTHLWSQRFGGTSDDQGYSVATDAAGNVYLTGYFWLTANFGGGNLTSAGASDIFLAKFNSAGVHAWSLSAGDLFTQYSVSLAAEASGNVYATGYFSGSVNFGGNVLTSAGSNDIFLAAYAEKPQEPTIESIVDVGNDQGRQVKIRFMRSGHDNAASPSQVERYDFYRRDDALPAVLVAGAPGAELPAASWLFAGSAPAHAGDEYGAVVPTLADSTIALGQYRSTFVVRAATTAPETYFDSPPDSGYSLDNLAPGVPTSFAYSAGSLSWDRSNAEDFDYFTVYGSNTNSFGSATAIDYSVSPAMDVNASPYVFYFVTATDFSGNEGKPAVVNTLSGAGGAPKSYVLSISSYPNPFNPETTIRYTVPSRGRVTIDVYDARGAHIVSLVDGEQAAGAYTQAWGGRDSAGRAVSSGVYFVRLSHPLGMKTYKMVLLK